MYAWLTNSSDVHRQSTSCLDAIHTDDCCGHSDIVDVPDIDCGSGCGPDTLIVVDLSGIDDL